MALYVFEPDLWAMPEMDRSHFDFIVQSLQDLSRSLDGIGARLAIRVGELPDVFVEIARKFDFTGLYSHEETGNGFTYDLDRRVLRWARQLGIPWMQYPQNGVVRPLKSRHGWAEHWQMRMNAPITPIPTRMAIPNDFDWGRMPEGDELGLVPTQKINLQVGGESKANGTLDSFLTIRVSRVHLFILVVLSVICRG